MRGETLSEPIQLPLSWGLRALPAPESQTLKLPLSGQTWLAYADFPDHFTRAETLDWIAQQGNILIRGVGDSLLPELTSHPGQYALSGVEAELSLSGEHFERKSVRELVRRGLRHGSVREINALDNLLWRQRLLSFVERVQSEYAAPLRRLYRTHLDESHRCFVFVDKTGAIHALVSLVQRGKASWHTELLLRDSEAGIGVLEATLSVVFEALKAEGYQAWSLGEVPFHHLKTGEGLKSQVICALGEQMEFAYRAKGLYQFKEKFRPEWRDVYVVGLPKLRWTSLMELFFQSNCHQMVLNAFQRQWRAS